MSSTKPIHLYSHASGPNPWKVAIILEELGISYETEYVDISVIKQKPYTDVNPNGRVPAINDPNTGITLWESGAIIDYLIDTYDKEGKLSYTEFPQKYEQRMWEHFQMSGQGPYFGQLAWFKMFLEFHSEKNITSAIDRYSNEVKRVLSVIESHLTNTGKEYLVGDKCCYADLMFITWNLFGPNIAEGLDWQKDYPKSYEWHQKIISRPAVAKVLEEKKKASGQ